MGLCPITRRWKAYLSRIGLRISNEFLDRFHGNSWIDDQHLRDAEEGRDRSKGFGRIVTDVLINQRGNNKRTWRAKQQGVTVRCRVRDRPCTDSSTGAAWAILDDDRLTKGWRPPCCSQANDP